MGSLTIIPCQRCDAADRRRRGELMARATADWLAFQSPAGLTPEQIACARRLMATGRYGYGLSMRLARSTGWTVPS